MPSGWDVYYVVFLSAVLALGIPASLAVISRLIASSKNGSRPLLTDSSDRSAIGRRINTRFFLGANAAIMLIALVLILVPCVVVLQPGLNQSAVARALISIVTISGFAALALLYAARKGDLNWLRSFLKEEGE